MPLDNRCRCMITIDRIAWTANFTFCPLHEAAPELYDALEELLKAGQHEGPCDNCDPETDEPYDEAGACELHVAAAEARTVIAEAALLKANPARQQGASTTPDTEAYAPHGFKGESRG